MRSRASIQRKLTKVVMMTTAVALVIACTVFAAYEMIALRSSLIANAETLAKIVAGNSTAAVAFQNEADAQETLNTLRTEGNVLEAVIYTNDRKIFSSFTTQPDSLLPVSPGPEAVIFTKSHLVVCQAIQQGDKKLGTLYLKLSLAPMYNRLSVYGGILIAALATSLVTAYLLASRLQRHILIPIVELSTIAQRVSSKDYSVRAKKYVDDELGRLTDTFNGMLQQIEDDILQNETAAKEIHKLNADLEKRVRERTAELEEINKDLSRSNSELEQFAYVASHDLQEPLRMVTGFTQLLADEYKGRFTPEADEYISFVTDGSKRMARLVNDLLEYSRVGRASRKFVNIDCTLVLERVMLNLLPSIKDAEAQITHDPLPSITAEPQHLTQLLQNLIGNAIKFRPKVQPPKIHIGASEGDDHWRFSVRDNGIGMNPAYKDRIFLIFQRLHSRQEYPGTGIGLAICKKIVEMHRGTIWVESEEGKGSTFFFTIHKNLSEKKGSTP